jgi:hypothetical protein
LPTASNPNNTVQSRTIIASFALVKFESLLEILNGD